MITCPQEFIKKLLLSRLTPEKLAYASCVGIFIAFSPFLGFHWLLTILLAIALSLNVGIIFAVAHLINNPLTMVPLYLANNAVGQFIGTHILRIDLAAYDPAWMKLVNKGLLFVSTLMNSLFAYLGFSFTTHISPISLWSFMIGGHVLGILLSIIAYPFLLWFYKKILARPTSV